MAGYMLSATPPRIDEIEVTLVGPGYGECVIVHVEGEWIIIDSCRSPVDDGPAASAYLDYIGIAPDAVKVLACSHWHDDHIRGMGQLFAKYSGATFCLSGALRTPEFLKIVEIYKGWERRGPLPFSSGLQELSSVMDVLFASGAHPSFAHANQTLWRSASGISQLASISPSSATLLRANSQIAALVPDEWTEETRMVEAAPNHIAVAMHLKAGAHSILLGSDLEEEGDHSVGWSAVIEDPARPRSKASLYKVAHHGSETAEHPGIWSELLLDGPVTLITPFSRGHKLPTEAQADRIKQRSTSSFLSARQGAKTLKRRNPVARHVAANRLELVSGRFGFLRARTALDKEEAWTVELAGDAIEL